MELWRDSVVRPFYGGINLGARVGGTAVQGLRHATFDVPGRVLRTVDGYKLATHLMEHYVEYEQTRIVEEIVEREADFPLVDKGVVDFVLVSAKHSLQMARLGRELTEPYIEEIEEIMTDKGVKELTVVKAVANARQVMPHVITRRTHQPLWF